MEFHQSWFSAEVPVLPLNMTKVDAIAAMFKTGGYRSFDNYLSRAREEHGKTYLEDAALERACRLASRSANRGLGPSRQAASYDLDKLLGLDSVSVECGSDEAPRHAKGLLILGAFFMMREIEAAAAQVHHVRIDRTHRVVYWDLPVSKSDVRALGKTRSWGCLCGGGTKFVCPYCEADGILQFHAQRDSDKDSPFFQDRLGRVLKKVKVVEAIVNIMKELDTMAPGQGGDQSWGGHSMRVSGARHLAAMGLEISLIQLIGRWGSEVVRRYVSDAPLSTVTSVYKQKLTNRDLKEEIARLASVDDSGSLRRSSGPSESALLTMRGEVDMMKTQIHELELPLLCIMNDSSKIWHQSMIDAPSAPSEWKARCGWRFGFVGFTRSKHLPTSCQTCRKCMPRSGKQITPVDDSSDDSSLSESADSSKESRG